MRERLTWECGAGVNSTPHPRPLHNSCSGNLRQIRIDGRARTVPTSPTPRSSPYATIFLLLTLSSLPFIQICIYPLTSSSDYSSSSATMSCLLRDSRRWWLWPVFWGPASTKPSRSSHTVTQMSPSMTQWTCLGSHPGFWVLPKAFSTPTVKFLFHFPIYYNAFS